MTWRELMELFARYVWPFILAWNIYLFQLAQGCVAEQQKFELYVARNFTAKADLEKLLAGFEARTNQRFEQLFQLINRAK